MAVDHEGLPNPDSCACANGKKSFGLCDGETEGLLAENMLPGFGGLDGPGNVKMIGKRIVDRVDIGIG
jgi:hypothetical protein